MGETVGGNKLRINIHKHFGQMHATGLVQCARIIDIDKNVCGGKVHTIDKVLTPPSDNVVETLKNDHSEFAKLIDFAGLKDSFSGKISTILAPVNSAFESLEEKIKTALFTDKQTAESVVRNHVVNDALCCSSIPRHTGFLQMSLRKPSDLGEIMSLRRSNGGHIFFNQASVLSVTLLQLMVLFILLIALYFQAICSRRRTKGMDGGCFELLFPQRLVVQEVYFNFTKHL